MLSPLLGLVKNIYDFIFAVVAPIITTLGRVVDQHYLAGDYGVSTIRLCENSYVFIYNFINSLTNTLAMPSLIVQGE